MKNRSKKGDRPVVCERRGNLPLVRTLTGGVCVAMEGKGAHDPRCAHPGKGHEDTGQLYEDRSHLSREL